MTAQSKPHLEREHAFQDASVVFAVDVSGSTAGKTLAEEKIFVRRVASLLASRSQIEAVIVPWNSNVETVRTLAKLDTLKSDSLTQPVTILTDSVSNLALRRSSVWFLLTDGMILDSDRERFAKELAAQGFHGLTCVTIIFGTTSGTPPIECNISVGVSVYAAAPNCLFLYYDVSARDIYIISAKGVFRALLGSKSCQIIDDNSTWETIPRLNLAELSSIRVPPAKILSQDELALHGDVVVNLEDLWSNKLNPDEVSNILSNEEGLSSIVMTAQTRNRTKSFQTWIQQQDLRVSDPIDEPRCDLNENALSNFCEVMSSLKCGNPPNSHLQHRLSIAYTANMAYFNREYETKVRRADERSSVIQSFTRQSMTPVHSPSALSSSSKDLTRSKYSVQSAPIAPFGCPDWQSSYGDGHTPVLTPQDSVYSHPYGLPPRRTFSRRTGWQYATPNHVVSAPQPPAAPRKPPRISNPDILYTQGFRKSRGSFTGRCAICGVNSETLAWLFHRGPSHFKTPGFPGLMESSTPAFPLAAGNFPETDVLCAEICCEACSYFCAKTGSSPSYESITGALPMVTFAENEVAYKNVLFKVLGGRFDPQYVTQIFLSILLSNPNSEENRGDFATQLYRRAILWSSRDIIYNSTSLPELSLSFSLFAFPSQLQPLSEALKNSFQNINEITSSLIRYPVDGFVVALRAAIIADIDVLARRRAVFRRYLFLLVETFKRKVIGQQAMKLFLQTEEISRDQTWPLSASTIPNNPPVTPRPKLTLPISEMRGSPFLDELTYKKLGSLADFKFFEREGHHWVGPATATFLHAMIMVNGVTAVDDPWDLFNTTMNQHRLGGISVRPEDYSFEEASQIIQYFT